MLKGNDLTSQNQDVTSNDKDVTSQDQDVTLKNEDVTPKLHDFEMRPLKKSLWMTRLRRNPDQVSNQCHNFTILLISLQCFQRAKCFTDLSKLYLLMVDQF